MIVSGKTIAWTDPTIRACRVGTVRDHGEESDIKRLVELAEPNKKELVVDMVSGLGYVSKMLAPKVKSIDAVEPDAELIDEARRIAKKAGLENIKFIEADPVDIPCKDAKYDIAVARMALRHLGDGSKLLREAHRVLKPTGRLLIADSLAPPHPELEGFLMNLVGLCDSSHVRSFTLAELENTLGKENFDIDLIEIYPKLNTFEKWIDTIGIEKDNVRMIEMMLKGASDRAKRHFRIIESNGKLVSFVTWMILIRSIPAAYPAT